MLKLFVAIFGGNVSGGGGIGGLMRRLLVVSSSEGGSCGVLPISVGVWL